MERATPQPRGRAGAGGQAGKEAVGRTLEHGLRSLSLAIGQCVPSGKAVAPGHTEAGTGV